MRSTNNHSERLTTLVSMTCLSAALVLSACAGSQKAASTKPAPNRSRPISAHEIEGHLRFLASDALEGRGMGSRGIQLAAAYHEAVFRSLGLQPAFGKGYRQPIMLQGARPDRKASIAFSKGGKSVQPKLFDQFVLNRWRKDVPEVVEGDVVYAGYLIQAPERKWDDLKGMNLKDKVLLVEVNEPENRPGGRFEGEAMTYYGRWTYKYEKASALGAKGVLIIHNTKGAAYGWDVVKNSWSREELYLPEGQYKTQFHGWIDHETAVKTLELAGLDRAKLKAMAEKPSFKPVATGLRIRVKQKPTFRELAAENIAGRLRGRHPARREQAVVITAHYDHLGRDPSLKGDQIYNGALDNCSASASMLALARRLVDRADELEVDVIFLAATAEEVGLLGSRAYVARVKNKRELIANINLELTNVWGETEDVYAIGAAESDMDAICRKAAERQGLRYIPEQGKENGFFYRSDQLAFALAGIPAVWLHEGVVSRGPDPKRAVKGFQIYKQKHYHRPSDEPRDDWDLRGTAQIARWAEAVVFQLSESKNPPSYNKKSAFSGKAGQARE
jgi:Zn-dependent M28 family amino/carboxypeptidase